MKSKKLITIFLLLILILTGCKASKKEEYKELSDTEIIEILDSIVGNDEILIEAALNYFSNLSTENNNMINSEKLSTMLNDDNIYILDIRQANDFAQGNIPGSKNIFWFEIGQHLDQLPLDKHIIVSCYSGQTSSQVVGVLSMLGYKASALMGGWGGWSSYTSQN